MEEIIELRTPFHCLWYLRSRNTGSYLLCVGISYSQRHRKYGKFERVTANPMNRDDIVKIEGRRCIARARKNYPWKYIDYTDYADGGKNYKDSELFTIHVSSCVFPVCAVLHDSRTCRDSKSNLKQIRLEPNLQCLLALLDAPLLRCIDGLDQKAWTQDYYQEACFHCKIKPKLDSLEPYIQRQLALRDAPGTVQSIDTYKYQNSRPLSNRYPFQNQI